MLRGKKVLLRPVKRSDISFFLKWFNDPEVTQYLERNLPITEMAEEKWIEELATRANSCVAFVIEAVESNSNEPIGNCVLREIDQRDHTAKFGITIGEKEYWSKGYGTEATQLLIDYGFRQLNLHRISSCAYEFNERSIRMHKKVGFKEEGRLRKARFRNGRYWDEIVFGILREEWDEKSKKRCSV